MTSCIIKLKRRTKGGRGSGNWGHSGRPGMIGGSAPGGGTLSTSPQPQPDSPAERLRQTLVKASLAPEIGKLEAAKTAREEKLREIETRLSNLTNKQFSKAGWTPEERVESRNLFATRTKLAGEVKILNDRINKAKAMEVEYAHKAMALPDSRKSSYDTGTPFGTDKKDTRAEALVKGRVFVESIMDKKNSLHAPTKIPVRKGGQGRASASENGLNITTHSGVATVVHEMGHFFEDTIPGWNAKAVNFLNARTQGQSARSLNALTREGGYSRDEVSKPDNFIHPYMGKIYKTIGSGLYSRQPTEIISMGMEYLYKDPVGFAQADPEYFNFMVGLVRGE